MFFDAKEYHGSNKQVANILSEKTGAQDTNTSVAETKETVQEATLENMDDGNWGDDDELDIDMGDDLMADNADNQENGDPLIDGMDAANADSDIFVPPSLGADPISQSLRKNP